MIVVYQTWHGLGPITQGSHLAGSIKERVEVDGAPATLLDSVTSFLIHQRAVLRQESHSMQSDYNKPPAGTMLNQAVLYSNGFAFESKCDTHTAQQAADTEQPVLF